MRRTANGCSRVRIFLVVGGAAVVALALLNIATTRAGQNSTADPWTPAQLVQSAEFARELESAKDANRPTILYVGFRTLFDGGHIPGATFHGQAGTAQGLAELKKWAATRPRASNLVIYCGCCPFEHCPNIRPAFIALREMGFHKLRVLAMPESFAVDWVDKGYRYDKGEE